VVKGVDAVIHAASPVSFGSDDPDGMSKVSPCAYLIEIEECPLRRHSKTCRKRDAGDIEKRLE